MSKHDQPGPVRREISAFLRALSGAYLFGIPLLYTMEMWWLGSQMSTFHMLLVLAVALAANYGLSAVGGFKHEPRIGLPHLDQALDAMAVGAAASLLVLLVLNQVTPDDSLSSTVGKIVAQTLPLSIGASLASAVFGKGESRQGDEGGQPETGTWKPLLRDVGATAIGAMFIAATIAPTEEVPMLAASMDLQHLLALIALSLLIAYGIVFASGFDPEDRLGRPEGIFQHPWTETTVAYVVALGVALGALFLVQSVGQEDPPLYILEQVLVLGLPASVGGAAGRLAV